MAAGATMRTLSIALSDVDRGVYEQLQLRVAQHPSESLRYLWTRVMAYCLSYEEGIQFSKGGLSNAEESPVAVRHPDGTLATFIDVGQPSAERLHKASKAADHVVLYSSVSLPLLRKEAGRRKVHAVEAIDVWLLPADWLDALGDATTRAMTLELVRTENQIYATLDGTVFEAAVTLERLVAD